MTTPARAIPTTTAAILTEGLEKHFFPLISTVITWQIQRLVLYLLGLQKDNSDYDSVYGTGPFYGKDYRGGTYSEVLFQTWRLASIVRRSISCKRKRPVRDIMRYSLTESVLYLALFCLILFFNENALGKGCLLERERS